MSFPSKKFSRLEKLEIVHTDLSGPARTRGFYGERYFMIFVDDFTRMMWIEFLNEKSKAFKKINIFKNRVENESGVKIKCLRLDRGGESTSRDFNMFCEENGTKRQLSSPTTPEQNGIVERRNKSVAEATTVMLFENDVSKTFWREAINIAVYSLNRVQIRKAMRKTP